MTLQTSLTDVLSVLALEEYSSVLSHSWEENQRIIPSTGPPFLAAEFITETCRHIGISREVIRAALHAAIQIDGDPSLKALMWHFHCCIINHDYPSQLIRRWPPFHAHFGSEAAMYYVIPILASVPHMTSIHKRRALPNDDVENTVADFNRKILDGRIQFGHPGIGPGRLAFMVHHLRGKLYQLARLQFVPATFNENLRVYRHRTLGTVLALSSSGIRYLYNGELDLDERDANREQSWTSRFKITSTKIIGNPISPFGKALPGVVSLLRRDWKPVLKSGDPILQLHIPLGSPMDFEACGAAFERALEFFPTYFPDWPFVAFCCNSWLLDLQLEKMLTDSSNLVRFLREVYRFPVAGSKENALRWIFGAVPADLTTAPQNTTLRRKIVSHFKRGGDWYGGGCFLLPEDLAWSTQVYRRQACRYYGPPPPSTDTV